MYGNSWLFALNISIGQYFQVIIITWSMVMLRFSVNYLNLYISYKNGSY